MDDTILPFFFRPVNHAEGDVYDVFMGTGVTNTMKIRWDRWIWSLSSPTKDVFIPQVLRNKLQNSKLKFKLPVPMKGGRETWAFKGYSYSWRFVTKRILFQWLLYCYPQNIVFLCFPVEIAVNSLPFTQLSKNQVFTYAAHVVEIPPTKRDHGIDHV